MLQEKAKDTVQKYTIAYKGVWNANGWNEGDKMWSVTGMDSAVKKVVVKPFNDEQYIRLMRFIARKRKRKLWLVTKIAAYTGASLSGICGMSLRGFDAGSPSLFLPETKNEHRPRVIPCHTEIIQDAVEWAANPLKGQTVTNGFSELKKELGFGREYRLHSFRHSVATKLENARLCDREIKRVLGHRIGSLTFDTYSGGLDYPVLADVIGRIKWPEANWGGTG